jgi:hypothetical protein
VRSNSQRQLRRRCDAALRGIEIPHPWDIRVFLAMLSERRGRPIILDEAPQLVGSVSAYWWKDAVADLIFYAPTQSVFYRELNIFHEVGHMLCEHDRRLGSSPMSFGDMESLTTAAGAARQIYARDSRFEAVEEQEAEYTAYRIKLMVEQSLTARRSADNPDDEHMISAMRRTLGGPVD